MLFAILNGILLGVFVISYIEPTTPGGALLLGGLSVIVVMFLTLVVRLVRSF